MKRILLNVTVYRIGERIYSIIPELSKYFKVDVYKTAQMGNKIEWYGDKDYRKLFDEKYKDYIDNIFYDMPNINDYDLILFDDCRPRNGLKEISAEARRCDILTIANYEGNGYFELGMLYRDINYWDKLFLFGNRDVAEHLSTDFGKEDTFLAGGIPSNDDLKKYDNSENNILVICNFLGNRNSPFDINIDYDFINKIGLEVLQNEFNKNVIFKLKSRADHPYPNKDIDYIRQITPNKLEYDVVIDCEDDNQLISDSFFVISSPSTLVFKSIQKGIPTILIKNSGLAGSFSDFRGLIELNTQNVFDEIEQQYKSGKDENFILDTLEGGIDFTATEKYVNNLRRFV